MSKNFVSYEDAETLISELDTKKVSTSTFQNTIGWVSNKNLLKNNAKTLVSNGVTFTINSDGTVTANGTANGANALLTLTNSLSLQVGTSYKVTGTPAGGGSSTYFIVVGNGGSTVRDTGNGVTFTPTTTDNYVIQIVVANGTTVTDLVFSPMVFKATDNLTSYVQHIDNVKEQLNTQKSDISTLIADNTIGYTKNFVKVSGSTSTMNGVTFTYNDDGTITVNGTATALAYCFPAGSAAAFPTYNKHLELQANTSYHLNGVPSTAPTGIALRLRYNDSTNKNIVICEAGQDQPFTLTEAMINATNGYHLMIAVTSGTVCDNIIISPMIRYSAIKDSTFEPYVRNNKELEEYIAESGVGVEFDERDFVNDSGTVALADSQRIFTGTQAEWDALTTEVKITYGQVNITDDESSANFDVYSTIETKTNKMWIDGKPIYRKVLIAIRDGTWTSNWMATPEEKRYYNPTDIPNNIETLVDARAQSLRTTGWYDSITQVENVGLSININTQTIWANWPEVVNKADVIIEYTKEG